MTEQQQHPSSSSNVPLLDTFPEGKYLFETWLADAVQAYRRTSFGDAVSTDRERFLAQLVADKAAQWAWDQREPEIQAAADAELEACCEWLDCPHAWPCFELIPSLRAARRPKPPSLKEQALEALEAHFGAIEAGVRTYGPAHKAILRRAIAALPNG
jgi:hypothetical protein